MHLPSKGAARRGASCFGLVLGCGLGLFLTPALGSDLPLPVKAPVTPPPVQDWQFQATLYGWATALDGDVGIRNLPTTSISMPFSKVLDNLDGALMGSFFANNGQWLLMADIVLAKLSHSGASDVLGGTDYHASLNETVLTGAIGYMLDTGRPDLDFAVTAGLRYMRLKAELGLDPNLLPVELSARQTQWWLDPTVGFFAHWAIDQHWFVNAIADIGGFGVGSQISSSGYLGVGYNWTASFSTALGYRYLYEDYEDSNGADGTFRYKTVMHGPTVSFAWHF